MYRINIHAHSLFSDGTNSPIEMAREAKRLKFTALVLTDHYYGGKYPEVEITFEKLRSYNMALREAKGILPVIRGLEVAYGGEEFLLFGSSAIKWLIATGGLNTDEDIKKMREEHHCAMVLCHPMQNARLWYKYLDGYERHNHCEDYFSVRGEAQPLGMLEGKQAWHNSDAHQYEGLRVGYNLVASKITTEDDLIKYIKSDKHPECYLEINE